MNKLTIFLSIIVFSLGCRQQTPYEGYSVSKSGLYYKLQRIGETSKKPEPGDYITADIRYLTMEDSLFFEGRRKIQLQNPESKGLIHECFQMLAEDEAASFILPVSDFFNQSLNQQVPSFLDSTQNMKITLHVHDIQSQKEYELEKAAFLKWIEDFGAYEQEVLSQFINQQNIPVKPNEKGYYKLILQEGEGKKVAVGDTIVIHYEGRFLNGKFFDSTIRRKEAFGFVYGTEWQVVEGLDEAIGDMKEGEKALFILPSEFAFGKEGSSTGIVPPYTSVLFEVELVSVN
ncbi:MAG: FKBP-type peptidyl-prolyl cis-trans isomerase [Bacteroidota bacterium]